MDRDFETVERQDCVYLNKCNMHLSKNVVEQASLLNREGDKRLQADVKTLDKIGVVGFTTITDYRALIRFVERIDNPGTIFWSETKMLVWSWSVGSRLRKQFAIPYSPKGRP